MLTKRFPSSNRASLLGVGAIISAVLFLVIVGSVLYQALKVVLFTSEGAAAVAEPQIEDAKLRNAISQIEQWRKNQQTEETAELSVTPVEPANPTPTPQGEQPHIALFNGTAIAGLASQGADALRAAGFTQIDDIGNADRQDYTLTVIRAKQQFASQTEQVRQALDLPADAIVVEQLAATESVDIVIILGSQGQ